VLGLIFAGGSSSNDKFWIDDFWTDFWIDGFWAGTTAAETVVQTRINYTPEYVKTKRRKRDESILEAVYELVARSEEAPITPTVKVQKQITNVVEQAKIASTIQNPELQSKAIHQTMLQIDRLQITIIQHTIDAQKDEDAAIKALLKII